MMESPAAMIRRARENPSPKRPEVGKKEMPMPEYVPRHAVYTNLMRSHDRVRTQHLRRQS